MILVARKGRTGTVYDDICIMYKIFVQLVIRNILFQHGKAACNFKITDCSKTLNLVI